MKATERQAAILQELKSANQPIIARKLAEKFNVSRQIIVGDVALLRAAGEEIMSTPKGYLLNAHLNQKITKKIVCKHTITETADEINTVIAMGGAMLDVTVEHPVYGELTGTLNIFDQNDAAQFNNKVQKGEATLLSELTEGIHMHTLAANTMSELEAIENRLNEKGYLYPENN